MVNNYFGIYVQALLDENTVKALQKQLSAIKDLQVKVTPTFGSVNKAQIDKINKDLETQLANKLKDSARLDVTPQVNQDKVNQAKSSVTSLGKSLKTDLAPAVKGTTKEMGLLDNATGTAMKAFDDLIGTAGKVAVWGIATHAIYGTKRALQEMFTTFVAIEDKMVSIDRVTNNFDLAYVFDGAYHSAQKYGASLMDMLSSVEELARSYSELNERQVLAAAEAGVLASTVSQMDGVDAVGAIIAVSNAYGFAIENGEKLIDIANEVANNYSVTAKTITTAWEKSSAAATTFGVDIQNLTGYIAAISTITQESGQIIGNSLKTIMSRITTMNTSIESLRNVGVDVYDAFGNIRDVQDILADLALEWHNLSSEQQQNLAVTMAGRFQLTRFLALMNNWEIATNATTTALESEGSAAKENAVYLESYTARLNQLENAQSRLTETIYNSNVAGVGKTWLELKIIITELAGSFFSLADAMTFFIGTMVLMIGFLAKTTNGYKILVNVLMLFRKEQEARIIVDNIATKGLIKNRLAVLAAAKAEVLRTAATRAARQADLQAAFASKASAVAYGAKAKAATAAAGALGLLSKALFSIPGLAVVAVIGLIVGALLRQSKAAKEAREEQEKTNKAISEGGQSLVADIKKYEEMKLKVRTGVIAVGTDVYQEYLDVQEKLIELMPAHADMIKDETSSYKDLTEEVEKAAVAKERELKADLDRLRNRAQLNENKRDTFYVGEKPRSQEGAWYNPMTILFGKDKTQWGLLADDERFVDAKESVKKYIEELNRLDDTFAKAGTNRIYLDFIQDLADGYIETVDDARKFFEIYDTFGQEVYDSDDAIQKFVDTLTNDFGWGAGEATLKAKELSESIQDIQGLSLEKTLDEASSELSRFNNDMRDSVDLFYGVGAGTAEAVDNIISYINMFGKESDIVRQKADELSSSFIFMGEHLFANGEELLNNVQYLNMVSETLKIASVNKQAYSEAVAQGTVYVAKGYEAEWEAVREAKIGELEIERDVLEAKIGIWQEVVKGNKTSAEAAAEAARVEMANNQNKTVSMRDHLTNFGSFIKSVIGGYKALSTASKGDVAEAEKQLNSLNLRLNSVNQTIASWQGKKFVGTTVKDFQKMLNESNKTLTAFQRAEQALAKYENALRKLGNELNILQEQNKRMTDGSREWFRNLSEQERVMKSQQATIKEYIRQVQIQLQNTKLEADDRIKLTHKIQDLNLEYERLNTNLYNLNKTQEDYFKSQITDKLGAIRDLERTRHREALDNIKAERDAFQKQIDEQLKLMRRASAARSYEQDLNDLQEKRLGILNQISRLEGDDSRLARSRLLDLQKELLDVERQLEDLHYDRDVELRQDALNDLSKTLDDHYQGMEDAEKQKNELILSSLDKARDSLNELSFSLDGLQVELDKWADAFNNFAYWAKNFEELITTSPTANIVTATIPIGSTDGSGGVATTQVIFNISGTSKDASNIADTVVESLIKSGVITSGN